MFKANLNNMANKSNFTKTGHEMNFYEINTFFYNRVLVYYAEYTYFKSVFSSNKK